MLNEAGMELELDTIFRGIRLSRKNANRNRSRPNEILMSPYELAK